MSVLEETMDVGRGTRPVLPPFAWRLIGAVVVVQVAVLTALSGRYGFHRDELYFLAAGQHLAWGYVDQPPLTPMLARAATALFGDTPSGLRVVSTLLAAATVVVAALAAREFGGGRGAQLLTSAGTALAGYVLAITHMLATNSVDLLVWVAVGVLLLRVLRTGDGRWWVAVGVVVGVGLLNKWLVLLMVAAVGASVIAVGPRQVLRSRWLIAGIAVAALIVAPNVVWQATHGWPQFTVASGISGKDGLQNRVMFVPQQIVYLSPPLVPVWVAGLVRLWRDPGLRWARAFAPAYLVLAAVTLLLGGKPYYAVPMLLLLLAAGAEPTLRWLGRHAAWRPVAAAVAVVSAVISVLIGLPVLPTDRLAPVLAINKEQGEQVGWPRLVGTVADAWRQIPPDRRRTAVIFTENYGQAGAVERYGPEHGLPAPYSGHMSFGDWGPPPATMTGPVLIVGRFGSAAWQRAFTQCRQLARNDNHAGVKNEEQGTPITLCRLTAPWPQLWPSLRHYY